MTAKEPQPMKHSAITLALVLALAWPAPAAEKVPPVTATLTLPYAKILPGVPFDMVVRLHNTSRQPVTVSLMAYLHVKTDGNVLIEPGKSGVGEFAWTHWLLKPAGYGYLVLAPGQSVERVIDWSYSVPNWSRYPQLSVPGTYELFLELRRGPETFDDIVNYLDVVRTNTVHLERIVPQGEDEEIWKRMQEASDEPWSDTHFYARKGGRALAEEIIRNHAASAYYPYALILSRRNVNVNKDDIPPLVEAASRFVDSPAHAHLIKTAANFELYAARTGRTLKKDPAEIERHYALADQYYREALKTKNAAIRPAAEDSLRFAERDRATLRQRE